MVNILCTFYIFLSDGSAGFGLRAPLTTFFSVTKSSSLAARPHRPVCTQITKEGGAQPDKQKLKTSPVVSLMQMQISPIRE